MYSFTLPYIHSCPGFPIVLVGTFNKAKDIKAPSLNIVFREIVLTPLCWPMPGSGNWCVLQDVPLFAGAVRVWDTVGGGRMGTCVKHTLIHYVLKLSPARKDKQLL